MLTTAVIIALVLSLYCVQKKPVLGLLVATVLTLIILAFAGALEDLNAFCLAPMVLVVTLVRLCFLRTDTEEAYHARHLAKWILMSLICLLLMVMILAAMDLHQVAATHHRARAELYQRMAELRREVAELTEEAPSQDEAESAPESES